MKTHVQIKNTLRRHLDSINQIAELKNVMKIFIPECNMGNEATHMHAMVSDRPDVRTFWQKEDRVGVLKTHELTDNYQFYLNELIKHNLLSFYMYLFTNSRRHKPNTIKALLQEQMERYHYAQKDTIDRKTGKPNYSITGKMGHKQDDLLIATMMAIYFGRAALRDPRRIK